ALRARGFTKARVDGQFRALEDEIALDRRRNHNIDVVVDRLIVCGGIERRLTESVEVALQLADDIVVINSYEEGDRLFSRRLACVDCGVSMPEMTPRAFSFNSPHGACPTCQGLGATVDFDPRLVVPDEDRSLSDGAIAPWAKGDRKLVREALQAIARDFGIDLATPFGKLPKKQRDLLLLGGKAGGREDAESGGRAAGGRTAKTTPAKGGAKATFEGILPNLRRRFAEGTWADQAELEAYRALRECDTCHGHRLKAQSLAVRVKGRTMADYVDLPISEALEAFDRLELSNREAIIAERILREIRERVRFLHDVGVGYLTLGRSAATLSGGEGQRIRLATQIGANLTGVLYVLDEPSIGLHQRDNRKLLSTLARLRDLGNTVIVVEHDEETIRTADYVVDLGPGAGDLGGHVIFQGTPAQLMQRAEGERAVTTGLSDAPHTHSNVSLTGAYLVGARAVETPKARRPALKGELVIRGARENNLKGIDVRIPLGLLTTVTGVSGSGKSTLVNDILYRSLARTLYRAASEPGAHDRIDGIAQLDKVIEIDQSPIGRTPRSNPATYTGLFTFIRDLFAVMPEAKTRGFRPGRFSFNVKGGRCEACQGDGVIAIEMHFLPDVYVTCEQCKGRRYNRETLEVTYRGKSIADVLELTVDQALPFLENFPAIANKLQTLQDVGLGYVALGQSATTLSGGEAQRVKLAKELSKRGTGRTLYILDEPTTGLHFEDTRKLLDVLNKLVDQGNTIVVIEHNLDVIRSADHVIDLGPEGGMGGGRIVAEGTPEEVAANPASATGRFLTQQFSDAQDRQSERHVS
ncbi:MAG: excinuclease ABC subunit UvrA, partial [Vicinamibacterales bacterium]